MPANGVERRLAAILSADVVGYSRLMATDEEGTLARLKRLRREVVDPAIADNRGRLVKLTGDGALVEFASAVDALRCALAVQRAIEGAQRDEPADGRIAYRIGINVGDVMIDADDLYGDGVNVAARLQELAPPGGVLISAAAHDHVAGRVACRFDDLGERRMKNMDRPVRVYGVPLDCAPDAPGAATAAPSAVADREKPSIVVLPFANLSGSGEHEFFADGLTEDILTELSRFRHLFVISRNSAFTYKGRAANVRDVARELGVQYVLEGSVRRSGSRVRVTVQLIDAEADNHLWAERYDRDFEDIFAIQDELTGAIVAILPGRVDAAIDARAKRKPPENLAAYEYVLAGKRLHHRSEREANAEALRMMDRALALDPKYAHAHAWRGCILGQAWVYGWCADPEATFAEVTREMETALALDDNDSDVHRILAAATLVRRDHVRALYHQERALSLNPNDDLIVVQQGELLTWTGRAEEGIEWIRRAMRLNPYHPERFWSHLGRAYFTARRYQEAVEAYGRLAKPDATQHAFLAASCARLDDAEGARRHADAVLAGAADFSVRRHLATLHYRDEEDRAHLREALLAAGLPP